MIILENGAPELSQYETRRYAITTTMCTHMTFWRAGGAGATMPVIETDNGYKARIPDNLIANYGYIEASATVDDGNGSADVVDTGRFYVRENAIPENYAPDDYESPVYQGLYALIRSMQSRMDAGEFIGETGPRGPQGDPAPADLVVPAVNAYIAEYLRLHPEATIDEDIIRSAVNAWLANHPEATTTVQDGAISAAKLAPDVRENVEAVPGLQQDLTELSESIVEISENLFTFDCLRNAEEHMGYLNKDNAEYQGVDKFHCITTAKIPCKIGDTFLYKGRGEYSTGSVLYYNGNNIVQSEQVVSKSEYHEFVAPNGVTHAVFSSFEPIGVTIVLDVIMVNPVYSRMNEISDKEHELEKRQLASETSLMKLSDKTNATIVRESENLYTGLNEINGYISDAKGTETIRTDRDWYTTDYIYVGDYDNVCYSAFRSNSFRPTEFYYLMEYDIEKKPVKWTNMGVVGSLAMQENTAYIRFAYHKDSVANIMIVGGTEAPSVYKPYSDRYLFNGALKKWVGKKWVAVGDSLTAVNSMTTLHYHDYIADSTGIEVVNFGVGGTGYKRTSDVGTAFYQRVENIPTDFDVITIFGSFNDVDASVTIGDITDTGTDTFCGAFHATIDKILEKVPTAQIGVITPSPWETKNPYNGTPSGNNYVDKIIAMCKMRSIPCLDLYHCSNLRPWDANFRQYAYSKDNGKGTHPDETGHKIIAPRFEAFLDSLII